MTKQRRRFSTEEKLFIEDNYADMANDEIASKLGISKKQVKTYIDNARVQGKVFKKNKPKTFNELLGEANTTDIKNKTPIAEEIFDTKNASSTRKQRGAKYSLNEHYFDKIDNEYKAYWLGFLYADGYVCNDVLEVTLSNVDYGHLKKLSNSLQSDAPIREKNIGKYKAFRLAVCCTGLTKALSEKGCYQKKSLTLQFPTEDIVPSHLVRHFIRGYFDGDGCIYVNVEKKRCSVSFVGTEDILKNIISLVSEKEGLCIPNIQSKGQAFQVGWYAPTATYKWFNYLYKDANIFLDRKYEKFSKLFRLE